MAVSSKTIVFIHGLFMNPLCWSEWVNFFSMKGFTCHTPAYPFHEGNPPSLRQTVHPDLGQLTLKNVIGHLSEYIDKLPEKPIIIGHSMGGLITQKMIAEGRGTAGVCISSAPPKGIFSFKWSFLKSNLPVINPFKVNSVCLPSVNWFQYAMCQNLTQEQTAREFDRLFIPESRNIPRSSAGSHGYIDFKKPHEPLLFIAGEEDHIIPSSLNRKNFYAYTDRNSKTDFKEFPHRTHHICAQQGWQEVATFALDWMNVL